MVAVGAQPSGTGRVRPGGGFAPSHPWDRNFFLTYVALIWGVILMGFVPDIVQHLRAHKGFPWIVHVHAAAFVGWLVLLTVQVLLVRGGRTDLHRRLGLLGAALAASMVVLAMMTSIVMDRLDLVSSHPDPAFLSVQIFDMVAFAGAVGAALLLRRDAPAHKRLILLATLSLVDAGFARWLGEDLVKLLGGGTWAFAAEVYLANFVLIAGIGAYDLVTRRRLHRAYVAGAAWVAGLLLVAAWLHETPGWKPVAAALIRG